jgi:hypothetical protein
MLPETTTGNEAGKISTVISAFHLIGEPVIPENETHFYLDFKFHNSTMKLLSFFHSALFYNITRGEVYA